MKTIQIFLIITLTSFIFSSCTKDQEFIGTAVSDRLWLEHEGAQMPILVEGNTASKTFILILHGGPGGTATSYNESYLAMSQPLEEKYAVAYWDQRLSGNSKGKLSEDQITIELMLEDTDKAIDLLKLRYGQDISIFLFGHSWGGYLGNAYLAQGLEYQQKVKGWIDVAGAHDIEKIARDGLSLMEEVASLQIAANSTMKSEWGGILNYVQGVDAVSEIDSDLSLEINGKAWESIAIALTDNLFTLPTGSLEELISGYWHDNHFFNNRVNNVQMSKSNVWKTALEDSLSDDLENIFTPSLLLWGKYDFVVPPSLGEEMFAKLGTSQEDKFFHVFESGHSPMHAETDKFLDLLMDFVEAYK